MKKVTINPIEEVEKPYCAKQYMNIYDEDETSEVML